jgi:hypothetical protein
MMTGSAAVSSDQPQHMAPRVSHVGALRLMFRHSARSA